MARAGASTAKQLTVVPNTPRSLEPDEALRVAGLFKSLANDTRLRLLHALTLDGELCVTDLAERLDMKPQAISNQLQRLALARIVQARREGVNIRYRIVDACVEVLLRHALCLSHSAGAPCPPARRR